MLDWLILDSRSQPRPREVRFLAEKLKTPQSTQQGLVFNSEVLKQPRTVPPLPLSVDCRRWPLLLGSDAITTHRAIKSERSNGGAAQPPACMDLPD